MYTTTNFKSKKELKAAIAAGERVGIFQPGPFGGNEPSDGVVFLEGPHYPEPHRWYAKATVKDGIIVRVEGAPRRRADMTDKNEQQIPNLMERTTSRLAPIQAETSNLVSIPMPCDVREDEVPGMDDAAGPGPGPEDGEAGGGGSPDGSVDELLFSLHGLGADIDESDPDIEDLKAWVPDAVTKSGVATAADLAVKALIFAKTNDTGFFEVAGPPEEDDEGPSDDEIDQDLPDINGDEVAPEDVDDEEF